MAGKTTNLQLQKIDDTDYAGNFPTIYNNNLDLIDNIQSKWKLHTNNIYNDIITTNIRVVDNDHKYLEINILKNLRFNIYCIYSPNTTNPEPNYIKAGDFLSYKQLYVNKGKYEILYTNGILDAVALESCILLYDTYSYSFKFNFYGIGISYNENESTFTSTGVRGLCLAIKYYAGSEGSVLLSFNNPTSTMFGRLTQRLATYSAESLKQACFNNYIDDTYFTFDVEYQD